MGGAGAHEEPHTSDARSGAARVRGHGTAASASAASAAGGGQEHAVRHRRVYGGWLWRAMEGVRSAARGAQPPADPCSSALRRQVESPMAVLTVTLFLLVYLVVLGRTGPQPDSEEDRWLLAGVSVAGPPSVYT